MLDLIISSIKSCKNWLHVIFEYGHKLVSVEYRQNRI